MNRKVTAVHLDSVSQGWKLARIAGNLPFAWPLQDGRKLCAKLRAVL